MRFSDFYLAEKAPTFKDIEQQLGIEKGGWIDLGPNERNVIKSNLYQIIQKAYMKATGEKHFRILNPHDVVRDPKLKFWSAADVDEDPHADAVLFGQQRNGIKISGFGHDGKRESVDAMMNHLVELLKDESKNFWIEASGATERALKKRGAPVVTDKETISKLFGGKIEFGVIPDDPRVQKDPGEGWYKRELETGHTANDRVFGHPKV